MPDLSKYQVDHLFLLVGGNPLPNAVVGKLLIASNGTITLIHSKDTMKIAQSLSAWFTKHGVVENSKINLKEVEESSAVSIVQGMQDRLKAFTPTRVGLHYTGGTKMMAVHAYRAMEQWTEKGATPKFSYLDARTLQLIFDSFNSSERKVYVGEELKLKLTDLLELHGWELKNVPSKTALLSNTARALARTCGNVVAFNAWKEWTCNELRSKCRHTNKDKWKSKTDLLSVQLILPQDELLKEVVDSLRFELKQPEGDLGLSHAVFENKPVNFCAWLDGKWLEHYVLDILNALASSVNLHELAQNIVPQEVEFDVDVIALRGYQLFALSCSTDTETGGGGGKARLKFKLFEAYVRARQLGGDEAQVALVCCCSDPDELQHEMRRDVDLEGRIRVFGRAQLTDLSTHITRWIKSLTLRSQPNRMELTQGLESNLQSMQIEFGLERKMVKLSRDFQQFQLDVAAHGREEMVRLGRHRLGG